MSLLAQGLEYVRRAYSSRTSFETENWTPAPEFDPSWAARHAPDPDEDCRELDQRLRNRNLGLAIACSRWHRGAEHDPHTWDHHGTVAQCPGWRGTP